jgi:tellurite resistance protein
VASHLRTERLRPARADDAAPSLPLNLFAIPFGLIGLADCWLVSASFGLSPVLVARVLVWLAFSVWLFLTARYAHLVMSGRQSLRNDLDDDIISPFGSLIVIIPTLAATDGLVPLSHTAGLIATDIGMAATVLVAGWFAGRWVTRPINLAHMHPAYFLPAVAGGFVAAYCAAATNQLELARMLFGLGLISWVVVGSVIFGRLVLGPTLPPALTPTLAVQVAPAGVATIAAFTISGGRTNTMIEAIAGYGLLMVVAQAPLLAKYIRLPFMPSFWAFAFAWSAVAFATVAWLGAARPTGWRLESYAVLSLITVLVAAIALRTIAGLARGTLLQPPATSATTPSQAGSA